MVIPIHTRRFVLMIMVGTHFVLAACNKYLDKKPTKSLIIPDKLIDLKALLDNHFAINEASPALLDLVADDYYVNTAEWQSATNEFENLNYLWEPTATHFNSWARPYQGPVYYANIVLDQLKGVTFEESEQELYNDVRGSALFYRAFAYHQVAQLYCRPYSTSAATDRGIVLRTSPLVTDPSGRSTVNETYQKIIADLKEAGSILPSKTTVPTRPSKAAAWAALARVCLSMRDYDQARIYAEKCLSLYDRLMDYNTLLPIGNPPISRFNPETIFYNHPIMASIFNSALIDSGLYKSYAEDDLRKEIFFSKNTDGSHSFRGGYDGTFNFRATFDGLATDEVLLIRAECYARKGNTEAALKDLNTLMLQRWRKDLFQPYTANDPDAALQLILQERRKELLFRGVRWSDLRRLNEEGRNITIRRIIDGKVHELAPGDPRWVMLIPSEVIKLSGIEQNPR